MSALPGPAALAGRGWAGLAALAGLSHLEAVLEEWDAVLGIGSNHGHAVRGAHKELLAQDHVAVTITVRGRTQQRSLCTPLQLNLHSPPPAAAVPAVPPLSVLNGQVIIVPDAPDAALHLQLLARHAA